MHQCIRTCDSTGHAAIGLETRARGTSAGSANARSLRVQTSNHSATIPGISLFDLGRSAFLVARPKVD